MARKRNTDSARIFPFTRDSIERKARPPGADEVSSSGKPIRQKAYWDARQECFGVIVSRTSRTYIVQKNIGGKSVRVKIGRYPVWAPEQAREEARQIIAKMDQGINPNQQKRERAVRGVTFGEAVEMHIKQMAADDCAAQSIKTFRDEVNRHLPDWIKLPLVEFTKRQCVSRHQRITKNKGPVAANRALMFFRAAYNTASRVYDHLPNNPVSAVRFNKVKRRREPISWADLPDWAEKVRGLGNPVRRDLQLFVLLTGLRSLDARTVRWEHIDWEAGTLHRPKPKGGEDRAFTIPLSKYNLDLLRGRREDNKMFAGDDKGWVFPTRDMKGRVTHVQEMKELRYAPKNGDEGPQQRTKYLPSPHRLRNTFATACGQTRIGPIETKTLMNHTLPGNPDDVTEGYMRPDLEYLRECVETVTAFLLGKMEGTDARE